MRAMIWPAWSRLFIASDGADWSLAHDARELGRIARRLGFRVMSTEHALGVRRQAVMHTSQFVLLRPAAFRENRIGFSYFHGRTRHGFAAGLDVCYAALRAQHEGIWRVHVSNRAMRDFVLESGIDPAKIHLIPIGVDTSLFRHAGSSEREAARRRFGVPENAVTIGSFQKDGVGWGEGLEPKLIKGPDVFLALVQRLRALTPALFVVLSGPARGYVRRGLERLAVPYAHHYVRSIEQVAGLYHCLDLYAVTSREEGGPKAVLEAMASGVPLVTTRVGQAMDLVRHGENAWMVDVDDIDGLVHWCSVALRDSESRDVLGKARRTAEANAYSAQDRLWSQFFEGFVLR